jgi:hypothetical protein
MGDDYVHAKSRNGEHVEGAYIPEASASSVEEHTSAVVAGAEGNTGTHAVEEHSEHTYTSRTSVLDLEDWRRPLSDPSLVQTMMDTQSSPLRFLAPRHLKRRRYPQVLPRPSGSTAHCQTEAELRYEGAGHVWR